MESNLQYCPRCKNTLPYTSFYKNSKKKAGIAIHCIKCSKEMYQENRHKILLNKKEYYIKNIDSKKEYNKAYANINKESIKLRSSKNYTFNKESILLKTKTYAYKSNYNITLEEFKQKLVEQGNKCLGCNKTFTDKGDACLDHNHKTGKVRGILCRNCNWALGHANDDINILKKIIIYLTKHQ